MERSEFDAVVIGGGFFGAVLAQMLTGTVKNVLLLEREAELLTRASYHNQARVHAGYHYPRSLMTAVRSRVNFPRFIEDFRECIVDDFEKYYAVARSYSKVSAGQFWRFMERVGSPLQPAPKAVAGLFNRHAIEAVYRVREVAFDATVLRRLTQERLSAHGVHVQTGAPVSSLHRGPDGAWEVRYTRGEPTAVRTKWVFNCTYSGINSLRQSAGLEAIPLKHELTEMALVEPPPELRQLAVTVMCGPFFSLMPFPARGLWTLSHVRFTPHHAWHDSPGRELLDASRHLASHPRRTHGPYMIRDAARYLPAMARCRQEDSLWEVKTVLPQSEIDDGRPILFHHDPRQAGFVTVMGGKLDNIYDLPHDLAKLGLSRS